MPWKTSSLRDINLAKSKAKSKVAMTKALKVRSIRKELFAGGVGYETALRRVKLVPELREHDAETVDRALALWEAKLIAASFIRRARNEAGMTQETLASELGVPRNYVTQTESFTSDMKVPLDFLVRVSRATAVPLKLGTVGNMSEKEREDLQALIDKHGYPQF